VSNTQPSTKFVLKGNVLDLAVAVIIGAAFGAIGWIAFDVTVENPHARAGQAGVCRGLHAGRRCGPESRQIDVARHAEDDFDPAIELVEGYGGARGADQRTVYL
jgi:hypothetical protein